MKPCFADTSYYLALINRTGANCDIATLVAATLRRRVVTTEFVLLELAKNVVRYGSHFVSRDAGPAHSRRVDGGPHFEQAGFTILMK